MKHYTITGQSKQDIRYEIGNVQMSREEHLDSDGKHRMYWVLRKDNFIVHCCKTWEDMILEMMIWSAEAMEA